LLLTSRSEPSGPERVRPQKRLGDSRGPGTYKEVPTDIKIVIHKETYTKDMMTKDEQDLIPEELGRVFCGSPK
jgi:hypothetical protein